jgi:hypothetical protein
MAKATEKFAYDRTSKWLIQHHGDSILRLGGLRGPFSWRPLQAEMVQPRQLPDGLLEVQPAGQANADLYILEIATYPDRRLVDQVLRDMALVYLDRQVLPEVLALILHPKGQLQATASVPLHSPQGWTEWQVRWRVVELWKLAAADLLAAQDVGLVPWVPLTSFDGPPEPVLQQCRERIDQHALANERENLLVVTQVLTQLRYNDPGLLAIFGGSRVMIESPLIQELLAQRSQEVMRQLIAKILANRFGPIPADLQAALQTITEEEKLSELVLLAGHCLNLDAFRREMGS